jgi:hypothetical protein
MKKPILVIVLFVLAAGMVRAGDDDRKESMPTGNLYTDLLYADFSLSNPPVTNRRALLQDAPGRRNIPLALFMSAAVPGLGQAYNRSWIKAAVAVGIESLLLGGYYSWRSQGNDGVGEYEAYAHQGWSPLKYAEWLNNYSGYAGDPIVIPTIGDTEVQNPGAWSAETRQQINQLIEDIRGAENRSIYIRTGAAFSHVLPRFGEQQYYELIGKYFQYAPGWSDYIGNPDANPEDPNVMPPDAQFYYYSGIHAEANDLLRRSSRLTAFILLNHFVAAIDAAVSAKLHNNRIQTQVSLQGDANGDLVTVAQVRLKF